MKARVPAERRHSRATMKDVVAPKAGVRRRRNEPVFSAKSRHSPGRANDAGGSWAILSSQGSPKFDSPIDQVKSREAES